MKAYLFSLGVGVLVGIIYGVLNVKSPAPPVVALVGLFGMLGGEQVAKRIHDWRTPGRSAPVSSPAGENSHPAPTPAEPPKDQP